MTPDERKAFSERMHASPGIIESLMLSMEKMNDTLRIQQNTIEAMQKRIDDLTPYIG